MTTITIKSPATGTDPGNEGNIPREVTLEFNFGADNAEASELFGAEVVHSKFVAQSATDLGNSMRRILNDPNNSPQDCLDFAARWKPGVVTKGPKAKSTDDLIAELDSPDITEERKQAIVVQLKAIANDARKAQAALKAVS